jgi:predicted  nucleic acid-binding Zn-ribbon protein
MSIADQVSELEDDLADMHIRQQELQSQFDMLEGEYETLKEELEEERRFISWVEANYPDARATYNALIKVKGEGL